LKQIDAEIARLKKARELLTSNLFATNKSSKSSSTTPVRKKRKMSTEARKRIAEAQRRRWAKARGKAAA
jgi:hypothetical protein